MNGAFCPLYGLPKSPILQHSIYRIFKTSVITGILKRKMNVQMHALPMVLLRFPSWL